ncbi:MAG: hypothetical protein B6242_10820 [Anaerolineaceae bacterium 4572_78]|nr:MAG: hypothetical protein B6242_10820 [Anaerolineaceae bacterium 4572_78]
MVIHLLKAYHGIVQSYQILQFEQAGQSSRLRMTIVFKDGSVLHVRETIINGSKRKYSYHWQNENKKLLIRWDNADHWQVNTKPHHKHVEYQNQVEESYERTLEQVLIVIQEKIGHGKDTKNM